MPLISLSLKRNELIDLSVDSTFKVKFLESSIAPFCFYARREYPAIASKALSILLPFSTSYLCEAAFSTMKIMKTKQRSRLQSLGDELHVSLSTIRPQSKSYVQNTKLRFHINQVSH
jgi:hypothetical protein